MAEMVKKATRESFGEAVSELANEYPQVVVLDADLAAATKTGVFKKAHPDRFIDCGIAESNMMGVAAGLVRNVLRGPRVRAGSQFHRLSAPEREDRRHARGRLRR